jgi:hypothetical protein
VGTAGRTRNRCDKSLTFWTLQSVGSVRLGRKNALRKANCFFRTDGPKPRAAIMQISARPTFSSLLAGGKDGTYSTGTETNYDGFAVHGRLSGKPSGGGEATEMDKFTPARSLSLVHQARLEGHDQPQASSCRVFFGVGKSILGSPPHTASMRSTARRAPRATTGSIVTSWVSVSSARRMFPSVILFMCGQRLHGRTNSMSG